MDKEIEKFVEDKFEKFFQKHMSFRAFKITDRATDSFGVNNRNATSSVPGSSVGKSQLSYETASLAFSGTGVSQTATVTSGDDFLGFYMSAFTGTPNATLLKLGISGTTLTGTLTTAVGTGNTATFIVILIKA